MKHPKPRLVFFFFWSRWAWQRIWCPTSKKQALHYSCGFRTYSPYAADHRANPILTRIIDSGRGYPCPLPLLRDPCCRISTPSSLVDQAGPFVIDLGSPDANRQDLKTFEFMKGWHAHRTMLWAVPPYKLGETASLGLADLVTRHLLRSKMHANQSVDCWGTGKLSRA